MTASAVRARFDTLQDVPDDVSDGLLSDLDEMVREVETTAQAAQREMTRLIKDLRPGSLQEQGLADALNDYTLLFGAREHILIYLEVMTGSSKSSDLSPVPFANPRFYEN